MEDKYGNKIKKDDFIYIENKKRKPRVGIVYKEDNELKFAGLHFNGNNTTVGTGAKATAKLNKYKSYDIEIISKEEALNIAQEESEK